MKRDRNWRPRRKLDPESIEALWQEFERKADVYTLIRLDRDTFVTPEIPPGETDEDVLSAAVDAFLRWCWVAKGRRFEPRRRRRSRGIVGGSP